MSTELDICHKRQKYSVLFRQKETKLITHNVSHHIRGWGSNNANTSISIIRKATLFLEKWSSVNKNGYNNVKMWEFLAENRENWVFNTCHIMSFINICYFMGFQHVKRHLIIKCTSNNYNLYFLSKFHNLCMIYSLYPVPLCFKTILIMRAIPKIQVTQQCYFSPQDSMQI